MQPLDFGNPRPRATMRELGQIRQRRGADIDQILTLQVAAGRFAGDRRHALGAMLGQDGPGARLKLPRVIGAEPASLSRDSALGLHGFAHWRFFMTTAAPRRLLLCAIGVVCAVGVGAQAPDNTKRNARDRQANAKTADQQSNARSDVDVTRQIRRAIVADKALSTNAHNVKIITRAGKVTLKGPVRNEGEKQAVEAKAVEVAGAGNVSNQLSVTDTSKAARKPAATPKER